MQFHNERYTCIYNDITIMYTGIHNLFIYILLSKII